MIRVRMLTTIATARSALHFGQTIEVEKLTPELRAWIADGRAELLQASPPSGQTTTVRPTGGRSKGAHDA